MIAFLDGIVAAKNQDSAFIEVGGIGYAVGMSASDLSKLPAVNEPVRVFTHLHLREDAIALFGFLKLEEKEFFLRLISVSGVGPKVALAALSVFSAQDLVSAITTQDVTAVSRIPGVGKKTASRIILELKGSLDANTLSLFGGSENAAADRLRGAKEALLSMGFSSDEADLALRGAPTEIDESRLVQYALKHLGA